MKAVFGLQLRCLFLPFLFPPRAVVLVWLSGQVLIHEEMFLLFPAVDLATLFYHTHVKFIKPLTSWDSGFLAKTHTNTHTHAHTTYTLGFLPPWPLSTIQSAIRHKPDLWSVGSTLCLLRPWNRRGKMKKRGRGRKIIEQRKSRKVQSDSMEGVVGISLPALLQAAFSSLATVSELATYMLKTASWSLSHVSSVAQGMGMLVGQLAQNLGSDLDIKTTTQWIASIFCAWESAISRHLCRCSKLCTDIHAWSKEHHSSDVLHITIGTASMLACWH